MSTLLVAQTLQEAIDRYGTPKIFNSDQGSQYTSQEHSNILKTHGIAISMNGKGRSIDNIAIERFFRTIKYEENYIKEYHNIKELKQSIKEYITFYNHHRHYSSLGYDKLMNVYHSGLKKAA